MLRQFQNWKIILISLFVQFSFFQADYSQNMLNKQTNYASFNCCLRDVISCKTVMIENQKNREFFGNKISIVLSSFITFLCRLNLIIEKGFSKITNNKYLRPFYSLAGCGIWCLFILKLISCEWSINSQVGKFIRGYFVWKTHSGVNICFGKCRFCGS